MFVIGSFSLLINISNMTYFLDSQELDPKRLAMPKFLDVLVGFGQ
jgi:hypothetical protein